MRRVGHEMSIIKLLLHPHIMDVNVVMQTDTHIFIVLKILPGEELYAYVL